MAVCASRSNMWNRGCRSFCMINRNFSRSILVKSQLSQCLKYSSSTSHATNVQSSSAEKPPRTDKSEATETNMEPEVDLSPKEKELLLENEKLQESVKELDARNWLNGKKLLSTIRSKFSPSLLEDKYKRALADNENIRNRMRREVSDAKQFGIQNFVKDLVEVADVLGKATESVPKEALKENQHLKSLFEGLQMTESQLLIVFKRHGVFPINPIGEKFNPNHHEALFEQEDSTKEPGTIGTVTQIGYRLHERVVRPAMVGVIKLAKQ